MLVLSREKDESIMIGENQEIIIRIIDIRGDKVRLGFEAPEDIPIIRDNAVKRERKESA